MQANNTIVGKQSSYKLTDKQLGSGAIAQVFLGININTQENVAIKIVTKKKYLDNKINLCYQSEYDISILLQGLEPHKNIVNIYDVIKEEQRFLVIMEYCEGGSLFDYLISTQLSSIQKNFFYIAQELIEGVEFLHQNSIIHRDLKPQNILLFKKKIINSQMLKYNNVEQKQKYIFQIKIGDYGFCKLIQQNKSSILGTINYMAPEIFKSDYNQKVDIWSLGVIFHELKTKQHLFTSRHLDKQEIYEKIKKFRTYSDKCNNNIDYLINLCLNTNSTYRITAKNLKVKVKDIILEQDYEIMNSDDNKLDQSFIFNENQQKLQDINSQRNIDISQIKAQNVLQTDVSNNIHCNQNKASPHYQKKIILQKCSNFNEISVNNSNLNTNDKKNNSSKENSESNRNEIQNSKMTLFNQINENKDDDSETEEFINFQSKISINFEQQKEQIQIQETQNSNTIIQQTLIKQHDLNQNNVVNKSKIEENSIHLFDQTIKQKTSFNPSQTLSNAINQSQQIDISQTKIMIPYNYFVQAQNQTDQDLIEAMDYELIEKIKQSTNISQLRDSPYSQNSDSQDIFQETIELKQYEIHKKQVFSILQQQSSIVTNPKQNPVFKYTSQETKDKNIKGLKGECKYMIGLVENYHKQKRQDSQQNCQMKTNNHNTLKIELNSFFKFSKDFIYSKIKKNHRIQKLKIKINFLKDSCQEIFKNIKQKSCQVIESSLLPNQLSHKKQVIKQKIVDVFQRYRKYECKQKIEFKMFSKKEYIYEEMTNYQIFIQLVINKIYHFQDIQYFFLYIMACSIYKYLSNDNNMIVIFNKIQKTQSFSESIYPQVCILFSCLLQKFLQIQTQNQNGNSQDSLISINPNQNKSNIQNNYEIIDCLVNIFIHSLNNLEIQQDLYNFAKDFMKPNKRKKEDSYYEFLDQKIYDLRDSNIKIIDDENPFNKIFFYVKDGIGHIFISKIQEFHFFKRVETNVDSKLVNKNY